MASTYLTRTVSSASNRKTWTYSAWIKRSGGIGNTQTLLVSWSDGNNHSKIRLESDKVHVYDLTGGSFSYQVKTNRLLRDTNAWYHIVVAFDTTQATASNRLKIYINGEQETSLAESSYPAEDYEGFINRNRVHSIGYNANNSNYFDGSMSHINLVDGTALTPSAFGSTDSTTGEWKINTSPSVTYGTNGFFILKDGNSVTDQSGQGNNWTVGSGTLTKTEDCPSNVFCTLNVLNGARPTGGIAGVLKYGNTEFRDGENGSNFSYVAGTIGANSGKYYWETKVTDLAEIDQVGVALASSSFVGATNTHGLQATHYGGKGCQFSNGNKVGDGSQSAYMGGFSVNDIMMVALDLDNNKITFGRNGQWADGSGYANQTYANSTAAYTNLTAGEYYVPAQAKRASGANYGTNNYNFGNGYFGTTAVASAGTNASGIGIFEYDVPTGFTALSTKGLNE